MTPGICDELEPSSSENFAIKIPKPRGWTKNWCQGFVMRLTQPHQKSLAMKISLNQEKIVPRICDEADSASSQIPVWQKLSWTGWTKKNRSQDLWWGWLSLITNSSWHGVHHKSFWTVNPGFVMRLTQPQPHHKSRVDRPDGFVMNSSHIHHKSNTCHWCHCSQWCGFWIFLRQCVLKFQDSKIVKCYSRQPLGGVEIVILQKTWTIYKFVPGQFFFRTYGLKKSGLILKSLWAESPRLVSKNYGVKNPIILVTLYGLESPGLKSKIHGLKSPGLMSKTYWLKSPVFLWKLRAEESRIDFKNLWHGLKGPTYGLRNTIFLCKIYGLKSPGLVSKTIGLKNTVFLFAFYGLKMPRFDIKYMDWRVQGWFQTSLDWRAQVCFLKHNELKSQGLNLITYGQGAGFFLETSWKSMDWRIQVQKTYGLKSHIFLCKIYGLKNPVLISKTYGPKSPGLVSKI